MAVRHAKSYIDRLYEAKDMFAIEGVIDLIARDRALPEQFWVSKRLFAWANWSWSGIWQYYEAISQQEFETLASALERFGLPEIAARYRSGMKTWKGPRGCEELNRWIDEHWDELQSAAFELIASDRHYLYE